MTKGEDGIYTIVVPDVVAEEGALYQTKVVQFVGGDPENAVWHGMDGTDLNVDFMMSADGDVTVTYNPETLEITVTGPTVIPPVYNISKITAVGAGQGNFLNGIVWNPDAADNKMTEIKPGVYEITFEDCDTNTDYQFKFAANGGWDMNWGLVKGTEAKLNEPNPSQYNSDNILFNVESEDETCNITIQLDISNWDTVKKTGATYTIFVNREEPTTEAPTTEEPTTVEPTTVEPTTVEPTTVEPTTVVETLTVNVSTSVSDHVTDTPKDFALVEGTPVVANVGDEFTLTWKLDSDARDIESLQWVFNYDASMELVSAEMNQITSGAYINTEEPGVVKANASNIYGYTVDPNAAFITLTFRAVEPGTASADMTLDEFALVPVIEPTTAEPTTEEPTTVEPTTVEPTTVEPTTVEPTTVEPTTVEPTTVEPTTVEPTTVEPTTVEPTTVEPTTVEPTTVEPTTVAPTTAEPTTVAPTTAEPTTVAPTTAEPTTVAPTTAAPTTTAPETTVAPTTKPKSTSDSATKDSSGNTSNNGTVKTGSASMAVIILLVLVSATAAIYFARRRDRQ